MEKPTFPQVIDRETGQPETVGNGRVAVIKRGSVTLALLDQLPETKTPTKESDVLDDLVASGKLRNSS